MAKIKENSNLTLLFFLFIKFYKQINVGFKKNKHVDVNYEKKVIFLLFEKVIKNEQKMSKKMGKILNKNVKKG